MSGTRDTGSVVNLRGRAPSVEPPLLCSEMIKGEARLLGSLVRSGKVVDYYRIDDGERVSYVYSERSDPKI